MLRVEVINEVDRSTHLKEEFLATDIDAQGRANRRIWVLEQQDLELKQHMELQRKRYESDIEKERNVSNGLRDRIGTLDEKRRRLQDSLVGAKKREQRLQSDFDALQAARLVDLQQDQANKEASVVDVTAGAVNACGTPSKRSGRTIAEPRFV